MLKNYEEMFGEQPTEFFTPLDKDDLDAIKKYQSLVATFQWAVSIGSFDIAVHVMKLGRCQDAPRVGHLE